MAWSRGHHCFRYWLGTCLPPSHHLKQSWHTVYLTNPYKFPWFFNKDNRFSVRKTHWKILFPKCLPFCFDLNISRAKFLYLQCLSNNDTFHIITLIHSMYSICADTRANSHNIIIKRTAFILLKLVGLWITILHTITPTYWAHLRTQSPTPLPCPFVHQGPHG